MLRSRQHPVGLIGRLSNLAGSTLSAELAPSPSMAMRPMHRQNRLKPPEIEGLVALYESGVSVNQLATQVKIHRTTVMAHLRRRGIRTRRCLRKLSDEQVHQAAALYADGLSLTAVGAEFDVDPGVIRKEFLKFGIQRRQPGRPQAIP